MTLLTLIWVALENPFFRILGLNREQTECELHKRDIILHRQEKEYEE